MTNQSTLNDMVRRIPIQSRTWERDLRALSAVQEQVLLHEQRMCGEGLPVAQQTQFSANYAAILKAVVDERISREFGRALLDRHRALIDDATRWICLARPDPTYGDHLIESLKLEQVTLAECALPFLEVCYATRTPLINGHRLWIEEMLIWSGQCRHISYGELGKIGRMAQRMERFECYYKRDGVLTDRERSELHRRLIEMHRTTLEAFAS